MSGLAGQRVLVIGLGISGYAAARALLHLDAKVRVTDSSSSADVVERAERLAREGAEVELGGHELEGIDADLAVVSPGIPPHSEVVQAVRAAGIEVVGEVELAYRLAGCDFLAVTGTNGKTTTTSLLAAMLESGGLPSAAAGNIGLPLIDAVFTIPSGGVIALEVSSFQLDATKRFRPRVAVLLNIAEDHTDWHGTIADYAAAKARITANQTPADFFVVNAADDRVMRIARTSRARVIPFSAHGVPPGGAGVREGSVVVGDDPLMAVDELPLRGLAGLEDTLAAAAAALAYGVDRSAVVRAVKGFRPLPHRLELVAEAGGVSYIDDSKATNPHATLAAVQGLTDVVLIAGGRSKGIDLSPLAQAVPPVRAAVVLGEARDEVREVLEDLVPTVVVDSMDEAVAVAAAAAVPGGSVLLSPGCASLDMYESYAQRGEDFARCVRASIGGA